MHTVIQFIVGVFHQFIYLSSVYAQLMTQWQYMLKTPEDPNAHLVVRNIIVTLLISAVLAFVVLRRKKWWVRVIGFCLPLFNLRWPYLTILLTELTAVAIVIAAVGATLLLIGYLIIKGLKNFWSNLTVQHADSDYATHHDNAYASDQDNGPKILGYLDVDGDHLEEYTHGPISHGKVFIPGGPHGAGWYNIK